MIAQDFTPIDASPTDSVAVVKYGIHRKAKLTIILLIGLIISAVIVVVLFVHLRKKQSTEKTTTTTTSISTSTKSEINIFVSDNLTNIINLQLSFGFPLNHSLYYDFSRLCPLNGFVTQVRFRLFNNWQGDHPLYIFIMKSFIIQSPIIAYMRTEIIHRYPIIPEKNNTQWQIFNIPKGLLSIKNRYNVGIGMQDHSHTNQIYAIKQIAGMIASNITNATIDIDRQFLYNYTSIAFIYTAIKDNIN